jgi:hypothetical protein
MPILQLPPGGKRPKPGTGRARDQRLTLRLAAHHLRLLDALAAAEAINRTVAVERAIELYAARVLIPEEAWPAPSLPNTPPNGSSA